MQLLIHNGTVDLSGEPILKQVNIEINTESRIGIVGRNGCGKTTLLRLISGELKLSKEPLYEDSAFTLSGNAKIGTLSQIAFKDESVTMLEEIRSAYSEILEMKGRLDALQQKMERQEDADTISEYTNLLDTFNNMGGFYFEKEYEAAIRRFGFTDADKNRPIAEFSGGQKTKIAFLKLVLSKPDLLLLDEPTNHLDIEAVNWLEGYLSTYKKAFAIVSHDRMFLDRTVNIIYEIEHGKTHKYVGNYTEFTRLKKERLIQQQKQYEAQSKKIEQLNEVVERFRYKATKAAMAQSKLKQIERMDIIDAPEKSDTKSFHADFNPTVTSAKDVLSVRDLSIGFDRVLSTVSFEVKRGDRIGIVGGNGLGKSTLLKTLVNKIPQISGEFNFGALVNIGYFEQQMAELKGKTTVFDNFLDEFPSHSDFEVRSTLAQFLFSGEDVFKTLDMLSGGERVRLALCKIFHKSPNLLILDEPTNHMDIIGKETLEEMLLSYTGTLIFVSHDRYFVKKLANKLLVFENGHADWFEYGYEEYEKSLFSREEIETEPKRVAAPQKKTYTTPLKEQAKREKALKKAEQRVAKLEKELEVVQGELQLPENISDYQKLSDLQTIANELEEQLEAALEEWESAAENLN